MTSNLTKYIVAEKYLNEEYIEAISNSSWWNLLVKTLVGETFEIEYDASNTIKRIKELIEDSEGIPADK